jgi:hypothetical protein
MIAVVMEMPQVPALTFALGMYLPLGSHAGSRGASWLTSDDAPSASAVSRAERCASAA